MKIGRLVLVQKKKKILFRKVMEMKTSTQVSSKRTLYTKFSFRHLQLRMGRNENDWDSKKLVDHFKFGRDIIKKNNNNNLISIPRDKILLVLKKGCFKSSAHFRFYHKLWPMNSKTTIILPLQVHFKEKGCIDLIIADELKSRPQASLELLSLKKNKQTIPFSSYPRQPDNLTQVSRQRPPCWMFRLSGT